MSNNFKKLSFPVPFLNESFVYDKPRKLGITPVTEILSPEMLELLKKIDNFRLGGIIIYYNETQESSAIHIDNHNVYDQTNLNFYINAKDSLVNWYRPTDNYLGIPKHNGVAVKRDYEIDKMQLIESVNLQGACLFQSGVPHNVSNITSPRWCVSIKVSLHNSKYFKWQDALSKFEQFIA
jgi:hypothetical protein